MLTFLLRSLLKRAGIFVPAGGGINCKKEKRLNGFTGRISSKLRETHLLEQYNLGSCFTLRPYKRCSSYH